MKRKIRKLFITSIILPAMVLSLFSGGNPIGSMQVLASEMPTESIMTDAPENENPAGDLPDDSITEIVPEESVTAFAENKLNYVYLDTKTVYTPSAQTVMVSYGNEQTQLAEAKLTVQNYLTGSQTEYNMADTFENTALFSLDYTASDRGIYEITDLHIVTTEGYAEQIHLRDTGMEHIYFGVDEEFEETDDADKALTAESYQELTDAYVTMQTESEAADGSNAQSNLQNVDLSQIEFQIVSLGSDGSQISTSDINDIKKALEAGETTVNKNARLSTESALSTEAEDYVVMLDPGHDATHCGANKNGLREEVLTLKIAQYCKAELEQYKHVKVYMTRESAACPLPGSTSVADNLNRVATAANVGADIYVSIHLNSAGTSTAKGAEVFYPNSNYRPGIGSAGANLATQIQRQLVALGLNNRGISIRNSGDGSRYPDGSLADYYAVIKHSKNAGFPGVIVEHAYVSNASDAAFLKSESNLQALGIADATGIAEYLGISKEPDKPAVDRDKVYAFVNRLYSKCFNRVPETSGLEYWTDVICNGEMSGAEVAKGFFFSKEMEIRNLNNRQFLEILYQVMMDRPSDADGMAYWLDYMGTDIEKEHVFKLFVESKEYKLVCDSYGIEVGTVKVAGRNRNPNLTAFVKRLYTKTLGREYDQEGLDYWCDVILDGERTILDVSSKDFFNSQEFKNKALSNEDFLKVLYRTFMDREYDAEGLAYWMDELKKGMTRDEVVQCFYNSKEFTTIRSNYGIMDL